MIETLRKLSEEAQKREEEKEDKRRSTAEEQLKARLSKRLEQIHKEALSEAKKGEEWLMIAKLDENSGFWGRHERKITPDELPYGDEQDLAKILTKEGFTISAGWHGDEYDSGDPPSGAVWCYWAISWKKDKPEKRTVD